MGTKPTWTNWAGEISVSPKKIEFPQSEDELVQIVRDAAKRGGRIRVAGSGHSFMPLCPSEDMIVSLDHLQGVIEIDTDANTGTVWAGSKIHQLGDPLFAAGYGMENMGDIDRQSLAGAISTGTHGTGPSLGSISTQVVGLRLITGQGEIRDLDLHTTSDLFKAAQVSLGALGVISQITLRLMPAYRLHERTWAESFDDCFAQLDDHIGGSRHFEFFWSPGEDACACKSLNPTNEIKVTQPISEPSSGRLSRYIQEERIDFSHRIFPSERNLLFNEMEFSVASDVGPSCLKAIRDLMLNKHPEVRWPIEYRTLAADDIWLSSAHGRETVTISIHQAAELPYQSFFADAEAIFREFGGRPHWGKKNQFSAADFRRAYPKWEDFLAVRRQLDPDGRFLNSYLSTLFEE